MLGGCRRPLKIVPPFMKGLAYLLPAAWAMDGYLAFISSHASARTTAILLFAMAFAALGIIQLSR